MPTYEYACQKCGHEFEQFQSMRDEPLKKCPKCKKAGLKRLVGSGAGLIFKGTGFYITDYKNKSGKPEGGGEKGGEKSGTDKQGGEKKGSGDGKGGESKPSTSESKSASSSSTTTKSSSESGKK